MNKSFMAALTTALVIGAASTTFAAANPFADVPADHWAYDAIAKLAEEGVVVGYGDGSYKGQENITRYEMASIIARAMANENNNPATQALLDKLSAEFSDELKMLGVRVSALEKKVGNFTWHGRFRHRFIKKMGEGKNDPATFNHALLRFEPTAHINKNWDGKIRIDIGQFQDMKTAQNETNITTDRLYLAGKYDSTEILLGKLPQATEADYGMSMDFPITGGKVIFGNDLKLGLAAGRVNNRDAALWGSAPDAAFRRTASNYQAVEVYNNRKNKFTYGAGYQRFSVDNAIFDPWTNSDEDKAEILHGGVGYKFTKDWNATVSYSKLLSDMPNAAGWNSKDENSYNVQLNWKGAKESQVGSYGLFVSYLSLGLLSTPHPTYREQSPLEAGFRGIEIGGSWTPAQNIVAKVQYFTGKNRNYTPNPKDGDMNAVWTEVAFIF